MCLTCVKELTPKQIKYLIIMHYVLLCVGKALKGIYNCNCDLEQCYP